MKVVELSNGTIINLPLIAWVENDGPDTIAIHFAVPVAAQVPGMYPHGSAPAGASDHAVMHVGGADAGSVRSALLYLQ